MDTLYGTDEDSVPQQLPGLDDIDYLGYDGYITPLTARASEPPKNADTPSAPFSFDARSLTAMLRQVYSGDIDASADICPELFDEVNRILSGAQHEGAGQSAERMGRDLSARMDEQTARFSAFKVHRMQGDVARRMLDSDGVLKPFERWKKDVAPMLSHHTDSWLRTEYDTAVLRARQAADWQRFLRHADVLPNLEWMPSTSAHPGADHRQYWGTILPVDHPFWDSHRPGDRWNCKCSLEATDEPCTPVPDGDNDPQNRPAPGLDNNPGRDGRLFGDSHPYIANAYPGAREAVSRFMRQRSEQREEQAKEASERIRKRRKELQRKAEPMISSAMHNKGINGDIRLTKRGIKEWLNQPHRHYEEKNEMLAHIGDTIKNAKYKGWVTDIHDSHARAYILETEVSGDKSWIIIRETPDGILTLHSITDSNKILSVLGK